MKAIPFNIDDSSTIGSIFDYAQSGHRGTEAQSGEAATEEMKRKSTEQMEITEQTEQTDFVFCLSRYFRLFRFSLSFTKDFLLRKQNVAQVFYREAQRG